MGLFEDDLATLYADPVLTVSASIGASSTRGFFEWRDMVDEETSGALVNVRRRVLTIVDGSLSGLAFNAAITIDGAPYRVRNILQASYRQVDVVVAG